MGEIDALMRALGPAGYVVLGFAALVEYVFPPFPGDTITLLGGAWVARGERSMPLVIVALTAGSVVGIAATWRVGLAIGGKVATLDPKRRVLGLEVEQLRRAQALMREKGTWLLAINRFLPSFRALLFIAAGAAGVPLPRALMLGVASALAWNTMLVAVGLTVGDNAERIETFFFHYRAAALSVTGVVLALFIGRFFWRRRRAQ